MLKLIRTAGASTAMGVLLAACGADAEPQYASAAEATRAVPAEASLEPRVLTITAGDFFFQAERTVPAGLTTIRLVNQGPELHHAQLIRLEDGHTLEDLMKGADQHSLPEWAVFVGGPNAPAPGAASETTVPLAPGNYVIACVIPSPDGTPHVMKGMVVPLTVTPSATSGRAPEADVTMVLRDYRYDLSGELTAGRRTIRVENDAEQAHEVLIVRLAPGKNAGDMLAWIGNPQGPPPGEPVGGTTNFARGGVNYVTADFEPGEYALYCFAPDHRDGRPHIAHGMIRQITVK